MRKTLIVFVFAGLVALLFPSPAQSVDGKIWKGLWDVTPGPRLTLTEEGKTVTGRWDCGCADGKRAIVVGEISEPSDQSEEVDGSWRCPESGGPKGTFSIRQVGGSDTFRGWYRSKGSRVKHDFDGTLIRR